MENMNVVNMMEEGKDVVNVVTDIADVAETAMSAAPIGKKNALPWIIGGAAVTVIGGGVALYETQKKKWKAKKKQKTIEALRKEGYKIDEPENEVVEADSNSKKKSK